MRPIEYNDYWCEKEYLIIVTVNGATFSAPDFIPKKFLQWCSRPEYLKTQSLWKRYRAENQKGQKRIFYNFVTATFNNTKFVFLYKDRSTDFWAVSINLVVEIELMVSNFLNSLFVSNFIILLAFQITKNLSKMTTYNTMRVGMAQYNWLLKTDWNQYMKIKVRTTINFKTFAKSKAHNFGTNQRSGTRYKLNL